MRALTALSRATFCALLVACNADFSRFHFGEPAAERPEACMSVIDSDASTHDAGRRLTRDAAQDAKIDDASTLTSHDAAPTAHDAALSRADASILAERLDAQMIAKDAGQQADDDAQVAVDDVQCRDVWAATFPTRLACGGCACAECTSPVLDCLSRADSQDRTLCTSLLKCAQTNGCHDWDCYCSTDQCLTDPTVAGDGPCAQQMEAAAGGGHDQVLAEHRANDPNRPLVRAVRANGCTIGTPRGSVGGGMVAKCPADCAR
jgi:hypothetical protein